MQFRTLVAENTGSVVVEFAIVIPVVLALTFAIVDIGRIYLFASYADQILLRVSNYYRDEFLPDRLLMVTQSEVETKADEIVGNYEESLSNLTKIKVTVAAYENLGDLLNDVEQTDGGLLGQPGDIVRYSLSFRVFTVTPFSNYFYIAGITTQSVNLIVKNGE